jgi:hypothetical protein
MSPRRWSSGIIIIFKFAAKYANPTSAVIIFYKLIVRSSPIARSGMGATSESVRQSLMVSSRKNLVKIGTVLGDQTCFNPLGEILENSLYDEVNHKEKFDIFKRDLSTILMKQQKKPSTSGK